MKNNKDTMSVKHYSCVISVRYPRTPEVAATDYVSTIFSLLSTPSLANEIALEESRDSM